MQNILLTIAIAIPLLAAAQSEQFTYQGSTLPLQSHTFECEKVSDLQGVPGETYQGLDAWGDYLVSLQNHGWATVYSYNGLELAKCGQFQLGSHGEANHANVASFTGQFYAKGDRFPLLLVSQANKTPDQGMKDVAYVERISNNMKNSTLVAIINFKDVNHLCGYALQWVADHEHGYLYGFANTVSNRGEGNQHRVLKFRMPQLPKSGKKGKVAVINLTERNLLENYLLEDTYTGYVNRTGQGLLIKNGRLIMPVGTGRPSDSSLLYVWDLNRHHMANVIDLSTSTQGELEDCTVSDGKLFLQTQGALYKITF